MSDFVPNNRHLWEVLIFFFHSKKTSAWNKAKNLQRRWIGSIARLGVTRQAISKRLHALGMIQEPGTSVPYDLKPKDVERRFFACE